MGGRMRELGLNMKVEIDRLKLIEILRTNKKKHLEMYEEAVQGYIETSKKEISFLLARLNEGKYTELHFSRQPPHFHGDAYTTALEMFEWALGDKIELSATEFRMLVQDQWEWKDSWLISNSSYSSQARMAWENASGGV